MEAEGLKFYTPDENRQEMECMELLRDYCGVNSIRLRVWVNPKDGWNNMNDVIVKAKRAERLGLRTMIDFHFLIPGPTPDIRKCRRRGKSFHLMISK